MGNICNDNKIIKRQSNYIITNFSEKPKNKKNLQKNPDTNLITPDDIKNLNKFQNKIIIQDDFFLREEDKNDFIYYELKQYERQKLEDIFKKEYEKFERDSLSKFKLEDKDKDKNIIESIISNENCKELIRKKIAKRIEDISYDFEKYNINYLTILLVGRKNVGKTTLIKYILESENGRNLHVSEENPNFKTYKSENVPYLKLIEFRGIGFNEGSSAKNIGNEATQLIKNHIDGIGTNNYNDFVHCIWYCISGTRFEKSEWEVFEQLKNSYPGEDTMPIIIVYTQTSDDDIADEMFKVINKQKKNLCCIKTVAKKIYLDEDNDYIEEKGKDELLKETLDKCTKALKGKMINLMIKTISRDLEKSIKKDNQKNEEAIKKEVINEFINEYKLVLNDANFINYIIKIFFLKLQNFFDEEMYFLNKSKNLFIQSNLVKDIKLFVKNNIKSINKMIINPICEKMAKEFINMQAKLEKNYQIQYIRHKRRFNDFIETSKKFLKDNFYYKIQSYIIDYLIKNKFPKYLIDFRKKVDSITTNLLKIEERKNINIKKHLENCFLIKLNNFAEKRRIMLDEPQFNYDENYKNNNKNKNKEDERLIEITIFNHNKFIRINEVEKSDDEINEEIIKKNEEWFTFKNRTITNNNNLSQFLQEVKEQESELNELTEDIPLNELNKYIANDLKNFFNLNKKDFIQKEIDQNFGKKFIFFDDNIIDKILNVERFDSIYQKKFIDELNLLINDNNFTKLDYITILVIGKSGVGKSTLINYMLKLEGESLFETGIGFPVTKDNKSYINKKLPFLNLIDTAGMELSKKLNPENILKNVNEADQNSTKLVIKENNNYNRYIQCIWYCINDSDLQEVELNLLKELRKKSIPLIVVYTHAIDINKIKRVKNKIKENFKDLPFIDVLAKANKRKFSYGLNSLLNLTLNICNNYEKGKFFNNIKEIASKKIISIFEKKNNEIEKSVNDKIIQKFISDFEKVLNSEGELLNVIYNLFELSFLGFLKDENEEKNHLDNKSKEIFVNSISLKYFITNFSNHYKNNVKNLIERVIDEKVKKYLDIQVKKEIDTNFSIKCENKRDEDDFKNIIEKFLNKYFYYISQKYIIYKIISEKCDSFSKKIIKEVNNCIHKFITSKEANELFKQNFLKKFDNLKDLIKTYAKNKKIYDCKDNEDILDNNDNKQNEQNNDIKEDKNLFLNKINLESLDNSDNLDAPIPFQINYS